MLQGKDGRRNQDCYLFAVANGLECSPDGYFRLSETYVTAHKAVHRTGILHILLDCDSCQFLIGSILVHERGLELFLKIGVGGECETFGSLALCVQLYQILCYILDPGLRIILKSLPALRSELIDLRCFPFPGLIPGNFVECVY